jgi:hypothetical protein
MTTQAFELQAVSDEELQAAAGGIAWGLLARGIGKAAMQAAPAAIAREGVSVGVHALSEHLKEEHKAA